MEYGYKVTDLFEKLIDDESWEKDPQTRLAIAKELFMAINRVVPLKTEQRG